MKYLAIVILIMVTALNLNAQVTPATATVLKLAPLTDGAWPCKYYWLNYNADIAVAEKAQWYSLDEDESDWVDGVGPFSNSPDQFRTTIWGSEVRPILVRRHFKLSKNELQGVLKGSATLKCSYDQDPKIYINGKLVKSYSGWNDNDYATYYLSSADRQLLREGDNVIAISLVQGEGGGHLDFSLSITIPYDLSIEPEPATPIRSAFADKSGDNSIFSLDGRYVGANAQGLTRGFYISNGSKFVVK